jgi:hypothetical protein
MDIINNKVRWGVLGYAKIARESLIPAIRRSTNSEFYALASREAIKLTECTTKFGSVKTYVGYDAILNDPQIEVVYIPLPNALHKEWVIKAAKAGKHILCEKPLALNTAECSEMIQTCVDNKVMLMEAFMYRFTHRTKMVMDILNSGVLGEIKFISSSFRFLLTNPLSIKLKPELGGGSLYDVGCYPINFTGMVADYAENVAPGGAKPIFCHASFVKQGGIDHLFSGIIKYKSGLTASINSGFNAQKRVFSEIIGTKGCLEVPETFFDTTDPMTLTVGETKTSIPVIESDRYCREVENFASCIRTGEQPGFSLNESLRNAAVLDSLLSTND